MISVTSQHRGALSFLWVLLVAVIPLNASNVPRTIKWVAPQSGWLYVLDSNGGHKQSQVWLIDPVSGTVQGDITVGYAPDMALSPDGSRLYVTFVDVEGASGRNFAAIDTRTANVLAVVQNPNGISWHMPAPASLMAVSADNKTVYVLRRQTPIPTQDQYYVAQFDVASLSFVPGEISLGFCPGSVLLPTTRAGLIISCSSRVLQIAIPGQSGITIIDTFGQLSNAVQVSNKGWPGISSIFMDSAKHLRTLDRDGQLTTVNLTNGAVAAVQKISNLGAWWIPYRNTVVSPDGTMLYVSVNPVGDFGLPSQILEVPLAASPSIQVSRAMTPSHKVTNMAMATSGNPLYASGAGGVTVIDRTSFQEVAFLAVGSTPSLIAVAP
jgi:hypothetical protein